MSSKKDFKNKALIKNMTKKGSDQKLCLRHNKFKHGSCGRINFAFFN